MLFDTRYFSALVTASDPVERRKLMAIAGRSGPAYVSSATVYEFYKASLIEEGRSVAKLRSASLQRDFNIVDIDAGIAEEGAEISHRLKVPMGDALIMATAKRLRLPCVTDDPHFTEVKRVWA